MILRNPRTSRVYKACLAFSIFVRLEHAIYYFANPCILARRSGAHDGQITAVFLLSHVSTILWSNETLTAKQTARFELLRWPWRVTTQSSSACAHVSFHCCRACIWDESLFSLVSYFSTAVHHHLCLISEVYASPLDFRSVRAAQRTLTAVREGSMFNAQS